MRATDPVPKIQTPCPVYRVPLHRARCTAPESPPPFAGAPQQHKAQSISDSEEDPGDPEPAQIFLDAVREGDLAPRRVDILDPQQEASAPLPRQPVTQQRRQRMAKVKLPGGRRGETAYDHGCKLSAVLDMLPDQVVSCG